MKLTGYEEYKFSRHTGSTHGNRWATEEELADSLFRMRLSDTKGIFHGGMPVIGDGDELYVDASDTHSLIIGSTGSKKTRLFAMPMLETFRKAGESVVVSDPKGELYDLTAAKFDEAGYKVYVINLRDPSRSHCWNPLALARAYYKRGDEDRAATIVNDFAATLIPRATSDDPFWDNTARAIFRGLAMMMVENSTLFPDEMVTLAMLRVLGKEINDDGEPGLTYELVKEYPEYSMARMNLDSVIRGSEKTFGNICVSYDAAIQGLYIQKSLIEMLSGRSINFNELGTRKTILYLIMPDEKTTLHMIVSLLIKQCYVQLIDLAQQYDYSRLPIRVNFLLDEFSSLPEIPDMSSMISAARSRNIRFHLVIQGMNQLVDKYGYAVAHTIKGNCSSWAFLNSRELPLLQEISDLCGISDDGYPMISTTQLQRLDKENGEALILLGRHYPFIAHLPDISQYVGYQEEPRVRSLPKRNSGSPRVYSHDQLRHFLQKRSAKEDDDFFDSLLD